MNNDIIYSASDEDWSDSESSIELAAKMFFDDMDELDQCSLETITIYKGVKKSQSFSQFLSIDTLLESMSEASYEDCGDLADGYLDSISDSQKKDLKNAIVDWASRHNIAPFWFMVDDIEQVEFTIPDDWR